MAGGRKPKAAAPARPQTTLVLDNGAYTLKAGLVAHGGDNSGDDAPLVIPNSIARDRARKIYVGVDVDRCRDYGEMQFRRPVEKGFIVNWEAQKEIWDHHLFRGPLRCDATETRLVLAEPPNGLPALQANCDQVVFEEYGFASYYRGVGPAFNAYQDVQGLFQTPRDASTASNAPAEVVLVIDSGYSHTTVTPVLRGQPLHQAVRRLDVGGKVLTNYLTRLVSMRHFDMRNDTYIVNEMKEAACFVSSDFQADLEACWKGTRGDGRRSGGLSVGLVKDYVLPDFHTRAKGLVRDYDPARHSRARTMDAAAGHADEDVVTLRNERFTVPELVFNPSAMGLRQPGLPDLVMQSLRQLPHGLWPGLVANMVVVGGNALLDGFVPRLQRDMVQRLPADCVVRVARPADPVTSTWRGAANMSAHAHMDRLAITKAEYEELGAALVARKFAAVLDGP